MQGSPWRAKREPTSTAVSVSSALQQSIRMYARRFFESKGMDVDIVKIEGSVELAPLLGLADGIVDIVETGVTLRENGLEVVEDVVPISARLIANTVSLKLRQTEIEALIQKIEEAL